MNFIFKGGFEWEITMMFTKKMSGEIQIII